jgi:hypothetical protein
MKSKIHAESQFNVGLPIILQPPALDQYLEALRGQSVKDPEDFVRMYGTDCTIY